MVTTGAVDPGEAGPPPVGSPVANTRLYVLDQHLRLVPAGVAGELWVGGAQVARGYAGRPALTAERFVADPAGADGDRLYRTGDRARWRADGRLEFVGRADEQVKVRGFRVEPGEVEAVLAAHPGVAAAAVAAFGSGADRRLAAYLVPADPRAGLPPAGEVQDFARERLPQFMVPSVVTEVASLPLTPNGKLDRAALPEPEVTPSGEFCAPSTPTEELLAGVWARVLGVAAVGAGDSFFALGGHSLLATRVISRVREVFGAEVALAALFDHPTVAGLAAVIDGSARGAAAPPIGPAGRDRRLPLSFAQQRLWFLDQLDPGSTEYNMSISARLPGNLDAAALGASLTAITARHEVLRTRLVTGPDGVAYQAIDPPSPFWLPVADVSGEAGPLAAARALAASDADAPFDLTAGPLIRACLVRLSADDHVLALSVHHVVFDEWSAGVLRRELAALYQAFRAGEQPLPPPRVQYADFAVWPGRCWRASWRTGGSSWPGCRCWSCPPTGRDRRSGRAPARWPGSPSPRRPWTVCGSGPATAARRCS
jgi:hypothetical protein